MPAADRDHRQHRNHQLPNANSPRLLTRLLELVARGVRSTRGLQEGLGVEARTVQYYTQAGQWLGLLEAEDAATLTPAGVDYVYAGARRPELYAAAVWRVPLAAELLAASDPDEPPVDAVVAAILMAEPELAPSTARRRASAIRALLHPAVGRRPGRGRGAEAHQLALPLALAPATTRAPRLPAEAQGEWSPDVYRYLLGALLDYGELTLGQVRALLDRAGAEQLPLGGYVDMALARGDASRRSERLVVTDDALGRAELAASTSSIILSDPAYRGYLADAVAAASDRAAEIRRDRVAARFKPWDRRVFGHPLRPENVREDLERVLLDRSLGTFPLAVRTAADRPVVEAPFLDSWESPDLLIACPPYLTQLQGGLAGVNALFQRARRGAADVAVPDLATRPVVAHGGIVHPGEPFPRSIPDLRSLRLRATMNAPYVALVAAVLLLHRQGTDRLEVVRGADGWEVRRRRRRLGELLACCDLFGRSRGWGVARRAGGLEAAALIASLEALGIAWVSNKQVVLEERFFGQLRRQPEEQEVFDRLQPLATQLDDWMQGLPDEPS